MTTRRCSRIAHDDLVEYAAGELAEAEAATIEEHLFACDDCGARAAELDGLLQAIPDAVRSAEVGGFVTDAVLNQLARDGVRMRTFALSPGAVVPCAVWNDDELMVLRLRADFEGLTEVTLSQRVGGTEVSRATGQVAAGARDEIVYVLPASSVRELPVVEIDVRLTAGEGRDARAVGAYTLVHGGLLHRA